MLAFATSPYIVTTWIGGPMATKVLAGPGWRWGFGMWAIITPVVVLPLVILFGWEQYRAKKEGVVLPKDSTKSAFATVKDFVIDVDLFGLLLLAGGMALFLLPFALWQYQDDGWRSALVISMIIVGGFLVIAFVFWEKYFAPVTFIPFGLLTDRTVFFAGLMFLFVFANSLIWGSYFTSMLLVVWNTGVTKATYISNIYRVGSCFAGLVLGYLIRVTGRFKWVATIYALPLMLLGVGLMIHFRQASQTVGYVIMTQIFVAFAGGPMVIAGEMAMNLPGAMGFLVPQPVLQISTGATQQQGGNLAYSISGVDPKQVYEAAAKMEMRLMEKVGTLFPFPPFSDLALSTPSLTIDVNREQASRYGVSASRVETLLRNAYSQNYVYLIKKPDDQYQVILEVDDKHRAEPEDLGKLYVRSDNGQNLIPLSAVASWRQTVGPQAVNHINQFTSVTFNFTLMPGVPTGEGIAFVEQVAKEVVPPQLRGSFQGEALTFRETISSLTILMALAVFVMYVILAILYESYVHPITVLSTLPTALVGGLATLVIFGQEASLYAFIGLFMLMGIVKKNGIMIVDFAIQRVAKGDSAEKAIHEASMDRFRPILMTTLAAVMGAVPIALGHGADGEGRRPLGLVIVGGLLVSQLITLYVTPVLYLYLELFQEKVLDRVPFLRSTRTHTGDRFDVPIAAHAEGNGNGNGEFVMAK